MQVFQIRIKLFLLNNIKSEYLQNKLNSFIDSSFAKNDELLKFHETNKFKVYCFDGLYPIEKDKIYKKDNIYTITLRTIDKKLADFFANNLVNEFNNDFKGLTSEIKIIPKKYIERIYSVSPVLLKNDGYWKGKLTIDDFERRTKENLIKKYNFIMNTKIDEDFQLYTSIEFKNKKPIAVPYKNIKFLCDKISLNIADNKMAQELAYFSLASGILEANSRGFGFVNFKYL